MGWARSGVTHLMASQNLDVKTVRGFEEEWSVYDQSELPPSDRIRGFEQYFSIFPWDDLPPGAVGFDLGCGSGRWAKLVAPLVGTLHCVDVTEAVLDVARRNLSDCPNCKFHTASVDDIPFPEGSMDFGYSLGVLHHVPDTLEGIRSCAAKLKPGAPLLLYLYYAQEGRPGWFRKLWAISDICRRIICRLPTWARVTITTLIALFIYYPSARTALLLERLGFNVDSFPLSFYRRRSFYTMRTDSLDRFGTRLEQRFTADQIRRMMRAANLHNITFSDHQPYWCAVGFKRCAEAGSSVVSEFGSEEDTAPPEYSCRRVAELVKSGPTDPNRANRQGWLLLLTFFVALSLLGVLKALPCSTTLIEQVDPKQVATRPTLNFRLGSAEWDVASYALSPELEPFRSYFQAHCRGMSGKEAATALSEQLAAVSPWGTPVSHYTDVRFDPVEHFRVHTGGAPSFCGTRSAIITTSLLSVGIPARLVHLTKGDGVTGHAVLEVWDARSGWVLVDVSAHNMVTCGDRDASAMDILVNPGECTVDLGRLEVGSQVASSLKEFYGSFKSSRISLMYPEPWVYLRMGRRSSFWPFRSMFVHTGPTSWMIGPAQKSLWLGILFCFVILFAGLVRALKGLLTAPFRAIPRVAGAPGGAGDPWVETFARPQTD